GFRRSPPVRERGNRMAVADPKARPAGLTKGHITFHHPGAFWFGSAATTLGVILMLPFYFGASDKSNAAVPKYVLAGTKVDGLMWFGMILSLVGIAACAYGGLPKLAGIRRGHVSRIRVRARDDAKLKPA